MLFQSEKLAFRCLQLTDAEHLLRLFNEPACIRNIGDKQLRTTADVHHYLQQGPFLSYQQHGFGLYLMIRLEDQQVLGVAGLLRRDFLTYPDVGYAVFEQFSGQGYASEAVFAVCQYSRQLGIQFLSAIVSPENLASKRVLQKNGFLLLKTLQTPESKLVEYFELQL